MRLYTDIVTIITVVAFAGIILWQRSRNEKKMQVARYLLDSNLVMRAKLIEQEEASSTGTY